MLGYELIHVNERGPWSNMVVLLKTDGDGVRISDGVAHNIRWIGTFQWTLILVRPKYFDVSIISFVAEKLSL